MLQLFLDSTPSVPLLRKPFLIKPRYEIDIAKRNGNQKHPRTFHFSRAQEKPFRAPKVPRGTKKPIPVALKPIPGTKKTNSWAPETPTGTEKHHGDKKNQSGKNDPTGRKNTIPGTKNTEPDKALCRNFRSEQQNSPRTESFENVLINDLLVSGGWFFKKSWPWKEPAHINILETSSACRLLKELAFT